MGLSFHQHFESIVEQFTNNIAIEYLSGIEKEPLRYTYEVLNKEVNRFARFLEKQNVERDDIVAVFLPRSPEAIIVILAIMKLGATYAPLSLINHDVGLYQIRQQYSQLSKQLNALRPKLILTNRKLKKDIANIFSKNVLIVDDPDVKNVCISINDTNLNKPPATWAYIVTTSGSTGAPKFIRNHPDSLLNRCKAHHQMIQLTATDRIAHIFPLNADPSLMEIMMALSIGACLCPIPLNNFEPVLLNYYERLNITTGIFLPHVLDSWFGVDCKIKKIIVMGDKSDKKLFTRLLTKPNPPDILLNGYGTSEAAIANTLWRVTLDFSHVLLGNPIPGVCVRVYRRDDADSNANENELLYEAVSDVDGEIKISEYVNRPTSGELYIGDSQRGVGEYLNVELNQKKFVTLTGMRFYKTGDKVTVLPGQGLIFESRFAAFKNPDGLWIYPERIESEIIQLFEAKFPAHSKPLEVVVEMNPDQRLLVVLLLEDYHAIDEEKLLILRQELLKNLPGYMVPVYWKNLVQTSGAFFKKDEIKNQIRQGSLTGLLLTPVNNSHNQDHFGFEAELKKLWCNILGLKDVTLDINHRFFDELGGRSIDYLQLAHKLSELYHFKLNRIEFSTHQTIAYLARKLRRHKNKQLDNRLLSIIAEPKEFNGKLPLFLIHPGDGDISCYSDFNEQIQERAIYAIDNPGFTDINDMDLTVEEMAEHYAELIYNKLEQHKECIIAGLSAGGLVGNEIRYLLKKKYNIQASLVLIDSDSPLYWQETSNKEYNERLREFIKLVLHKNKINQIPADIEFALARYVERSPLIQINHMIKLVSENIKLPCHNRLMVALIIARAITNYHPDFSVDRERFSPEVTFLFVASDSRRKKSTLGWSDLPDNHIVQIGKMFLSEKEFKYNITHLGIVFNQEFLDEFVKTLSTLDKISGTGLAKKLFSPPVLEAKSLYFLDFGTLADEKVQEENYQKLIDSVSVKADLLPQAFKDVYENLRKIPQIITDYHSNDVDKLKGAIHSLETAISAIKKMSINPGGLHKLDILALLPALYNLNALLHRSLRMNGEALINFTECLFLIENPPNSPEYTDLPSKIENFSTVFGTICSNLGHLLEETAVNIKINHELDSKQFIESYLETCKRLNIKALISDVNAADKFFADFGVRYHNEAIKYRGEDIVTLNGKATALTAYCDYLTVKVPKLQLFTLREHDIAFYKQRLETVSNQAAECFNKIKTKLKQRRVSEADMPLRFLINYARLHKAKKEYKESIKLYRSVQSSKSATDNLLRQILREIGEVYYLHGQKENDSAQKQIFLEIAKATLEQYLALQKKYNLELMEKLMDKSQIAQPIESLLLPTMEYRKANDLLENILKELKKLTDKTMPEFTIPMAKL